MGDSMRSALLVIDVQREWFDPEPMPFEHNAVVERINTLSQRARAAGAPVIFIQHEASDESVFGTQPWQLDPSLVVDPGDHRIRKATSDSFLRTELAGLLSSLDVTRVVACGYASEFCVDSTVRSAAAHGFEVMIASDAHTTHDKPHASAAQIRAHENATLANINSFGVPITAAETAEISFG